MEHFFFFFFKTSWIDSHLLLQSLHVFCKAALEEEQFPRFIPPAAPLGSQAFWRCCAQCSGREPFPTGGPGLAWGQLGGFDTRQDFPSTRLAIFLPGWRGSCRTQDPTQKWDPLFCSRSGNWHPVISASCQQPT